MRPSLIWCLLLLSFSCSTSSKSNDQSAPSAIYFGSGGGVSGMVTSYRLYENGDLVRIDPVSKEAVAMKGLKKRKAGRLFDSLQELDPCEKGDSQPDNYYYFVKMEQADQVCGWTWGEQKSNALDPAVIELYKELTAWVKP